MKISPTDLPGVSLIEPDVFRDDRGFFFESYHQKKYAEAGLKVVFVQDNHSRSLKGTLRGMHFQVLRPQGKLIRVLEGEIFDVAVDLRTGSPTYKKWTGLVLSAENFKQLYVPEGFAHGFLTMSDVAQVEYKCTEFYDKGDEAGVAWNDPSIGISWPIANPILSAKDRQLPLLAEVAARLSQAPAFHT